MGVQHGGNSAPSSPGSAGAIKKDDPELHKGKMRRAFRGRRQAPMLSHAASWGRRGGSHLRFPLATPPSSSSILPSANPARAFPRAAALTLALRFPRAKAGQEDLQDPEQEVHGRGCAAIAALLRVAAQPRHAAAPALSWLAGLQLRPPPPPSALRVCATEIGREGGRERWVGHCQ